ncbi:MBL fold metallo-hydrolase [Gracilinema caldarium]|uniref:Zn-dependent hydrolase n=1 Tax=Gracilinema caldarium (strain ATCC 51460 / DSM 7334 / H1) TaxID=744872 RepID=F8EZL5_GRAC1|nr:MBL fold metallo-hydrolase [Gracilinema caldarium]AEJ20739.1 Zn-dependent hydrolase [Gracilinema caldarium DSM 7334]
MNQTGFSLRFLGQNSFILTDARGFSVAIDPYLSDWCATRGTSTQPTAKSRLFPPAIRPEELDVDLVLLTHSHCDHADLETLKALAPKRHIRIAGPRDALKIAEKAGISAERIRLIHPGEEITFHSKPGVLAAAEQIRSGSGERGLRVKATFALPTDGSDLNHVGYLLQFSDGSTFWNTGDTAWCDILPVLAAGEVVKTIQAWRAENTEESPGEPGTSEIPSSPESPAGPDVMAVCINAGYGNLSHWDASRLAGAAHARYVLPAHWDLFPHNSLNPEPFRTSLEKNAPGSIYFLMERDREYRFNEGQLQPAQENL